MCKNYKRSAPGGARILAFAIGRAKKVAVSESCEIAHVDYLGQITNIGSSHVRKLLRSALGRARILVYTIGRAKKVAVSKLREIARVAYSGQITNIGSCRARKL